MQNLSKISFLKKSFTFFSTFSIKLSCPLILSPMRKTHSSIPPIDTGRISSMPLTADGIKKHGNICHESRGSNLSTLNSLKTGIAQRIVNVMSNSPLSEQKVVANKAVVLCLNERMEIDDAIHFLRQQN
jgi:hypothetical protein